jgi:hypothetical protein
VISRGVYETAEGVRHAIYWINHRPAWFGLGETARLYDFRQSLLPVDLIRLRAWS